ncbi:MAG: hypothetical protein ABI616_08575 [Pseudomonadota bacterium]
MSQSPDGAVARPQRRTLLLLLALFFAPLAVAFTLYYGFGWRPSSLSIHGKLVSPVRPMPEAAQKLRGDWSLVYVGDGGCDQDCRTALVFARQTHLSLAKEMSRLSRVMLVTGNCCDVDYFKKEHDGIKVFDVSALEEKTELMAVLPDVDLKYTLFVVDPLGNLVMRYDVRESPAGLLDDLRKLLKLSHIG